VATATFLASMPEAMKAVSRSPRQLGYALWSFQPLLLEWSRALHSLFTPGMGEVAQNRMNAVRGSCLLVLWECKRFAAMYQFRFTISLNALLPCTEKLSQQVAAFIPPMQLLDDHGQPKLDRYGQPMFTLYRNMQTVLSVVLTTCTGSTDQVHPCMAWWCGLTELEECTNPTCESPCTPTPVMPCCRSTHLSLSRRDCACFELQHEVTQTCPRRLAAMHGVKE